MAKHVQSAGTVAGRSFCPECAEGKAWVFRCSEEPLGRKGAAHYDALITCVCLLLLSVFLSWWIFFKSKWEHVERVVATQEPCVLVCICALARAIEKAF